MTRFTCRAHRGPCSRLLQKKLANLNYGQFSRTASYAPKTVAQEIALAWFNGS